MKTKQWRVIRTDDIGNSVIMAQGLTEQEAERIVSLMESRGHHQTYTAEDY